MKNSSDNRFETASDSRFDARFDSDFATSLLIDIAQERSLDGLMETLMGACTTLPEFARVEFWLIEKGDLRREIFVRDVRKERNAPTRPAASTWLLVATTLCLAAVARLRAFTIPMKEFRWASASLDGLA